MNLQTKLIKLTNFHTEFNNIVGKRNIPEKFQHDNAVAKLAVLEMKTPNKSILYQIKELKMEIANSLLTEINFEMGECEKLDI